MSENVDCLFTSGAVPGGELRILSSMTFDVPTGRRVMAERGMRRARARRRRRDEMRREVLAVVLRFAVLM